jgi:23S rRNA (adenine2503-C2)-methyltransferase
MNRSYFDEEEAFLEAVEQRYRMKQADEWIFQKYLYDFLKMTNLPLPLRERLAGGWDIIPLKVADRQRSGDGSTAKTLYETADGLFVESVLMGYKDRKTLCVSTQVGCRNKCRFCATGTRGLTRDLTAGEIMGQILNDSPLTNIVFMGMGEPLDNLSQLIKALRLLNHPDKMNFGARRITISTVGIPDGIRALADENRQYGLSWSLHAPTDDLRSTLIPVNRRYPINEVMAAMKEYGRRTGGSLTLEYILLKGVNDAPELARATASLARMLNAKVNLIPYNAHPYADYERPGAEAVQAFSGILQTEGLVATVRESKGNDIDAACGQLAGRHH